MNNDLRQQILVSLRAEGLGEADKAREQMARIKDEIHKVTTAFAEGTMEAGDFKKEVTSLGGQLQFFGGIVKETEKDIEKIDIGLHKLQVTAIKFGDDYAASMVKAAQAAEDLAIKEAEAFAAAATAHEQFLVKQAAAEEAAAAKKEAILAREIAAEIDAAQRTTQTREAAEQKEAERVAKMVAGYEQAMERQAKATEAAAAKDAATMAKAQADRDAYAAKVMKAIIGAEQATSDASEKINAALKEENAAFQRHAQVVVEAETEIERIQQRAAAAAVTKSAERERVFLANAKAATLQGREQQHFNDLLREGAAHERTAEKATTGLAAAKNKGVEASNKYGYGILHVSHALQDLQYGTGAVLNNIPLMVGAFGGGPGLAGVMMATAVAAQVLSEHIDVDLKAAFTGIIEPTRIFTGTVDGLNEKIKDLESNPMNFGAAGLEAGAASEKVKELQRAYEAMNAAKEGKTIYEKQAGREVTERFAEEGGRAGEVMSRIQGQYFQELEATSEGLKKQRAIIASTTADLADVEAKIKEGGDLDTMAGLAYRRDEILKARQGAFDAAGVIRVGTKDQKGKGGLTGESFGMAGGLLAGAQAGNETEKRNELVRRLRLAGEHGLATDVALANPAEMASQDATEGDFGTSLENMKLGIKVRGEKQARIKRDATAKQQAANEREQEVKRQASLFGGQFDDNTGPGSLDAAILGRAGKGQTSSEIKSALSGTMGQQLAGKVPADMVDDVADAIVEKAVDKVRAEVAAAGGGAAGVRSVAGERAGKLNRAAGIADRREGREQASDYEAGIANQIFDDAGGKLGPQGAMAAAHRAMQNMKEGQNEQQAAWNAMLSTIEDLEREAAHARAGMMGVHQRLNGVQAQGRRNRAQRNSPLPTFP